MHEENISLNMNTLASVSKEVNVKTDKEKITNKH